MEFKADKPLQLVGQAAEFKFESKFRPLQVIWQSLPKAFPDKRKFWLQNQWPSSWGCSQAQLWLARLASTNTVCFEVGQVGQWLACLRKKCYHSCYTDKVLKSKKFKILSMLCRLWGITSHWLQIIFFMGNEIFNEVHEILFPFSGLCVKIRQRNKYICSKLNPVHRSRIKLTVCPSSRIKLTVCPKGVCLVCSSEASDSKSYFRWLCARAWKLSLAWFWIDCSQSLQPKHHHENSCKWNVVLESHGVKLFWFKIFLNNLLPNLIWRKCPNFQVPSVHFPEVNELLDGHWVKIVLREHILQSMSNAIIFSDKRLEFWFILSLLGIQLEQFKNENPADFWDHNFFTFLRTMSCSITIGFGLGVHMVCQCFSPTALTGF